MTNTDDIRRHMIETGQPSADLAADNGPAWDTTELQRDFEVIGFAAPFVVVVRRTDGVKGTLEFTTRRDQAPHRVYFGFVEDTP